jgi:hypothetical protein
MRIVHFDSIGGASGDMILGALAAAGASQEAVGRAVRALGLRDLSISFTACTERGLAGMRALVTVPDAPHPHRRLPEVRTLLRAGKGGAALEMAERVFERLAAAEAAVHGVAPEEIHFHEVGALDAIADIVGSCAALEDLGARGVSLSPLPVGCGSVRTEHGVLPLPVPAVVELLKGRAVQQTDEPFELVTPTGAALLTTWAERMPTPAGTAGKVMGAGYGFGSRALRGRANALRATVLETDEPAAGSDDCLVLECNLDDTVPELIGALCGKLLQAGALDVFTTAVQMKKQRPGTLLTVLTPPDKRAALLDLVFAGCTTFGVREYAVRRTVLARRSETVTTPFGDVRVKVGTWKGSDVTSAPEHDDCAARAAAAGVSVRAVYEAALAAAHARRTGGAAAIGSANQSMEGAK